MSEAQKVVVTMAHVRAAGLCARGARTLAARYGLDWSRFLREGIDAEDLEATGDALALRVVALARAEAAHG